MKPQLKLIFMAACAFASCATPQKKSAEDLVGFYRLETSDVEGLVSLDLDLRSDSTYTMKTGILLDRGSTERRDEVGQWSSRDGLVKLQPKTNEAGSGRAVPHALSLKTKEGGAYLVAADGAHHSLRKIQIVQKLRIDEGTTVKEPNQAPEPTAPSGRGSS